MTLNLKTWLFPLTGAAVLVGTLFGGWLHGQMVTRWGADDLLAAAAKRLEQPLGEQLGNWRLMGEPSFSSDVVRILQCPAYVNRTYMHQQTGDVVDVAVIVGPPGPISVHTPEICYSSQDFAISQDRSALSIVDRARREHSLWQVSMEPRKVDGTPLRVLYAWGTGSAWAATENPRFSQAHEPYLYKIQVAGPPSKPDDEFNPCEDFLGWFLPEIQIHLTPTQQDSAVAISSNS